MPSFLLTWNPDVARWSDAEFDGVAERSAAGHTLMSRWGVGIRKSGIAVGDFAYLVRQRRDRGIVASGRFESEIYEDVRWDGSGRITTFAEVRFDVILPLADRLPVELLKHRLSTISWDHLQGSGVMVPRGTDSALEALWRAHATGITA
ncbi:hypothetical protein ACIA5D_31690 [Actinoplanes sp. NPDC051513]|uniref:hypothetical protein n=1 Tax=Actinoplanes sp. NPDC051513 TaxID=3363908 RepID=UPI0037A6FC60